MKELLTEEEYSQARATVLTAFFTSDDITRAMWDSLVQAGYTDGRVLEPGCGTGNFLATAPGDADIVGVEVDPISATIASIRHPEAQIRLEDFTQVTVADNSFAATIGNVPFSQDKPYDPNYNRLNLNTHNYFISKSIDLTAPGGYVAVVTSTYTADAGLSLQARKAFAERADFITGVRLPSGKKGAFRENAGTEAGTDILVFRVREDGQEPTLRTEEFIQSSSLMVDGQEMRINHFFAKHQENILGDLAIETSQYGPKLGVVRRQTPLREDITAVLTQDITEAKRQGLGLTVTAEALNNFGHSNVSGLISAAAEELHEVLGTVRYQRDETGALHFEQLLMEKDRAWVTVAPAKKYAEQWVRIIDMRDTTTALLTACTQGRSEDITSLQKTLNAQYDAYTQGFGPINLHEEKKPRKRSQQQITKEYQRLISEWRLENAIGDRAYEGDIPAEIQTELYDQASQPIVDGIPVRRHLSGAIAKDPFLTTVCALEHYTPETKTAKKGTLFFTNPVRSIDDPTYAESVEDALTIVAHSNKENTAENMAVLLGDNYDADTVVEELEEKRLAFRDPQKPETWVLASQYLSGPVRTKLKQAQAQAETDDRFSRNVAALKDAIPEKITRGISINLGATWIPHDLYKDFIVETLQVRPEVVEKVSVVHAADRWQVVVPRFLNYDEADQQWGVRAANAYGAFNYKSKNSVCSKLSHQGIATSGADATVLSAVEAIELAMNMQAPVLNYSSEAKAAFGLEPSRTVKNVEASRFAGRKTDDLKKAFTTWVRKDPKRLARVIDCYNEVFNNVVAPVYDGSKRVMPGLSENFSPYPYQLDAVERITNEESVLLNHVVGAGKTGSMIMGAMELGRMGLAQKPMMVVPNHLVEQIAREAKQWYPSANVLSGASARGSIDNRRMFMAQVATHDWDLIIVPESVFKRIPLSAEIQKGYINKQLEKLREDMELAKEYAQKSVTVKEIEKRVKFFKGKLLSIADEVGKDNGVTFDQSGVNYLLIDEAHGYKNLARFSGIDELTHVGSQKATDLDMKLFYLRSLKRPGQPTVTFATGTPIANSLGEIWVMQHYLRPDILEEAQVAGINSWGVNFTDTVQEIAFTAGGSIKEQTKVATYVNVSELARMCTPFMDYVGRDKIPAQLPEIAGGRTQVIEFDPGQEVKDFNRDLLWREDHLSEIPGEEERARIDNPLLLINHGKAATLDPRLAGLDHVPGEGRVYEIAQKVHEIWAENKDNTYLDLYGEVSPSRGGFQIIFCDKGVPQKGSTKFSVYEALRQELVGMGMDKDRIRFIHEWDDRRIQLFDDCNNGRCDVLIGNTEKLGTGANIQSRCVAIHHADVPWRPADLEQRDGRGHRQGNQNSELQKFVYIAQGTHDGFSWATLERKLKFIEQFWAADQQLRQMEPLSGEGDVMAHHKAIATGNPDFIRQVELRNEIDRLESLRTEFEAMKASNEEELASAKVTVPRLEKRIQLMSVVAEEVERWCQSPTEERTWRFGGEEFDKRVKATEAMVKQLEVVTRNRGYQPEKIGEIGGVAINARFSREHSSVAVTIPITNSDSIWVPESDIRGDEKQRQNGSQAWSGVLKRIESAVMRTGRHLEDTRLEVARLKDRIEQLEKIDQREEFEFEDELEAARKELGEVDQRIVDFDRSPEQIKIQKEYQARVAAKGRTSGFSLALNPTSYMKSNGIRQHPLAKPLAADPQKSAAIQGRHLLDLLDSGNNTGENPNDIGSVTSSEKKKPVDCYQQKPPENPPTPEL